MVLVPCIRKLRNADTKSPLNQTPRGQKPRGVTLRSAGLPTRRVHNSRLAILNLQSSILAAFATAVAAHPEIGPALPAAVPLETARARLAVAHHPAACLLLAAPYPARPAFPPFLHPSSPS